MRYQKSEDTRKFLRKTLQSELLFEDLQEREIRKMIQQMYRIDVKLNDIVVKEGETASAYFVIELGYLDQWEEYYPEFDINDSDSSLDNSLSPKAPKLKKMRQIRRVGVGYTFGADVLLYSVSHKYTYQGPKEKIEKINRNKAFNSHKELGDDIVCRLWALNAESLNMARSKMVSNRLEESTSHVLFFKSIEYFKNLHHQDLQQICQAAKLMTFKKNDKIVTQGEHATHFFIIQSGTCDVIKKNKHDKNGNGKKVASYKKCDSFGEKGIMKKQRRAATVIVTSNIVKAYAISASDFCELLKHETVNEHMKLQVKKYEEVPTNVKFTNIVKTKLHQFKTIGVLGIGAFGRVTLVEDPNGTKELNKHIDPNDEKQETKYCTYALKRIRKNRVLETGQQEHIVNEKKIMAALNSNFCGKLFGTYKDQLNVYFLLEPILGGELFSLLRANSRFNESQAKFYSACVVLAFEYLHNKNIIYRDLKPENLLIAKNGYCKLVDFGFAKKT